MMHKIKQNLAAAAPLYHMEADRLPSISLIGRTACLSDWQLHPRTIVDHELIVVYQGRAAFTIGEQVFEVTEGCCLLLPPNTIHSASTDPEAPCRFYFAHFSPADPLAIVSPDQAGSLLQNSLPDRSRSYFMIPETNIRDLVIPCCTSLSARRSEVLTLFEKALAERNQLVLNSEAVIACFLLQILILISRETGEQLLGAPAADTAGAIQANLQRVVFYLHEHYQEPVEFARVCQETAISQQYLITLFRRYLKTTPLHYLNQIRIDKAKELIRTSPLSIKQIAYAVGINNPYYFSRLFKKFEGVSPSVLKNGAGSRSNG